MVEHNRPPDRGPPPRGWLASILGIGAALVALVRVIAAGSTAGSPSQEARDAHHAAGSLENPEIRCEHSDASFGWILGIILGATVFFAIIYGAVWWFFTDYENSQFAIKGTRFPLAAASSDRLPPSPRLEQLNRMAEIERSNVFVREESKESILRSYGPAADDGYIHIPISRAMELLDNKLPVRKKAPADQIRRQNGLVDSGGPNSGRIFRGKAP